MSRAEAAGAVGCVLFCGRDGSGSASTLEATALSTSTSTNESVLVLNRTTRSLPTRAIPSGACVWKPSASPCSIRCRRGRAHRQNADRHRLAPGRYFPRVATASDRLKPWVPLIHVSSGRSGSGLNRSSPPVEAIWGFISTPVPTACQQRHAGLCGLDSLGRHAGSGGLVQRRNVRTLVVSE